MVVERERREREGHRKRSRPPASQGRAKSGHRRHERQTRPRLTPRGKKNGANSQQRERGTVVRWKKARIGPFHISSAGTTFRSMHRTARRIARRGNSRRIGREGHEPTRLVLFDGRKRKKRKKEIKEKRKGKKNR